MSFLLFFFTFLNGLLCKPRHSIHMLLYGEGRALDSLHSIHKEVSFIQQGPLSTVDCESEG